MKFLFFTLSIAGICTMAACKKDKTPEPTPTPRLQMMTWGNESEVHRDTFRYKYDADGYVIKQTHTVSDTSAPDQTPVIFVTDYVYDANHRLIKTTGTVSSPGDTSYAAGGSFEYDAKGNITKAIPTDKGYTTYTWEDGRLASFAYFSTVANSGPTPDLHTALNNTYDANGNLLRRDIAHYLIEVNKHTVAYGNYDNAPNPLILLRGIEHEVWVAMETLVYATNNPQSVDKHRLTYAYNGSGYPVKVFVDGTLAYTYTYE